MTDIINYEKDNNVERLVIMAGQMAGGVAVATRVKVPRAPRFNVVMYNDDVTTFEFVIRVLVQVFDKDEATARSLADKIDQEGSAIIGSYSRELAETYVEETTERARSEGFPLVCEIQE